MLTNDDKALILLCSHVGISNKEMKPLTLKEWNKLANKIYNSNIKRPENLFNLSSEELSKELGLSKFEIENIQKLLSRSLEIGMELERLYSKGIKVVTRASKLYPIKLRKILKDLAPPVIFYCGNLELANKDGIGVVGSRNIKEEYVEFTKKLVNKAIDENLVIFSGGAKGIDDTSEKEAFIQGGEYVSFLADSLEAKIKKKDIRDKLSTNRILLMTSNKPDVGFSVGSAMGRNKYIYALSNGTFIIASDYDKGGTWAGAVENLKHKWTKSFVRKDIKLKGNKELIKLGCISVEDIENKNITDLLNCKESVMDKSLVSIEQLGLETVLEITKKEDEKEIVENHIINDVNDIAEKQNNNFDLYYHVIEIIVDAIGNEEKKIEDLSELLNVSKAQLSIWMKRAEEDKKIKKLLRPVRFVRYDIK